jgi:crotonobetainyl-CoA hydratase
LSDLVNYVVENHIAVIRLNRPDAMNAINTPLADAIGNALETAVGDDDVRAIVVTGTGRAFCAGADLQEISAGRTVDPTIREWGFAGMTQHWIPKPVIAAVNGFAFGGGCEIMLSCDLVVASETAKLGLPEVKVGLFAAAGGVLRLQRHIPLKLALQLALTGDPIDAATAALWGLVNEVVPPEEVLPRALALAGRIAANAPLSVQYSKKLLHQTLSGGSDWNPSWSGIDPWQANQEAINVVFNSADAIEGSSAFAEKRPPIWSGT